MLGLAAGFLAVCCAMPLLLAAGLAVSTTALLVGSGIALAAGIGLAVGGWMRHRRRTGARDETTGVRS